MTYYVGSGWTRCRATAARMHPGQWDGAQVGADWSIVPGMFFAIGRTHPADGYLGV